jgi:hypothetical protein
MRALVVCALIVGIAPHSSLAQTYPFSQRGSVTQNVAYTHFSVVYGRPVARGRALFGSLVPWNEIWHPGADSATRLTFNHDITVEGKPLRAGEYTLWLIPRENAPWTLIFSRAAHVFHKPYPGEQYEVLRVDVAPEQVTHVESLTIDFPLVLRDEAILRIHWGTTAVSAHVRAGWSPN